jgi:hypothetical protein
VPPPAEVLGSWDEVTLDNLKHTRQRRYGSYREDLFRPIRAALASLA